MATVKITDLPYITSIQSNTSNTVLVGVDLPGDYTGQLTLTTLASQLYSNNNLNVGNTNVLFANGIGQFHANTQPYSQIVGHNDNPNGSMDFVATADEGTDTIYYIDLGIQGSALSQGKLLPLDSYLLAVGNTATTPGGNLIIGTDTPNKNVDIVLGGHETNNVVAQFLYGQGFKLSQKPIIFADGTSQNSAVAYTGVDSRISSNVSTINGSITSNVSTINGSITSNVNTLNASITANAASANAVINSQVTSNIATANLFTQAAFNKANNALANTSGIFAGNLSVTGDLSLLNGSLSSAGNMTVNGTMVLANSNFGSTEAALTIKATATTQTPSNPGYMLHISGKANTPSRIVFDSFSTDGSAYGLVAGRTARGTVVSPTATQNNDVLMRMTGNGWGTTGFAPLGVARIDIIATENYTDSARGSKIVMYNIANGSNTVQEIASFNANTIEFTGTVKPEKGFIYAPTVLPGSQTAFTIDFSTTSLIKANVAADCTVTLSNYIAGKVVEVWLTNTSGLTRTITHGCTSTNSTENSTTFAMPATSSAYLRYFSIDGDNANTFVAIQHA
jgi:hypothetical protein